MGKVRYKAPSENFERLTTKDKTLQLRASIGRDKSVGEYYFLSVDSLIPYKNQSRRKFDESEIIQLAATIKEYGIKNPLLVVSSLENEGKFEVVSGERRLRAARSIGLEKVPCIIIDAIKAEEIALVENIQRAGLHPVEIGNSIKSLLSQSNWGDITKLAEKIGKSQPTISNYLAYSKLPEPIKEYLIQNDIKERGVLRKLLKQNTYEEMKNVLGIGEGTKSIPLKNILRLNMEEGDIKIQDRSIYKLGYLDRLKVRNQLLNIISKIDQINDKEEKNKLLPLQ